jgi:hypothetical protein
MSDEHSCCSDTAKVMGVSQKDALDSALSPDENRRSLASPIVEIFSLEFSASISGANIR